MATCLRVGRSLLAGLAVLAWLVLAWLTTAPGEPSTVGALVAVVPYMAIALLMAWRSSRRARALGLWAVVAGAIVWQWPQIEARFEWIYFIQHFGTFALLAIGFGRTLAPGSEALITRLSHFVHDGPLPPALVRYTRGVTLAWTLFFGLMCGASALLFFLHWSAAWSLLVTLLTPALTVLMFAAEYLVRLLVLPREIRPGLVDSVRAVQRNLKSSSAAGQPDSCTCPR
jgi:uncharacterized membrane protein